VLAAAGLMRLPGAARPAASPAFLPPPRRPPAMTTLPVSVQVTVTLTPVMESSEVTTSMPAPVKSTPAMRTPEAPARRRKVTNRRAWQLGLAALAVLAAGVVLVNLPGNPVLGPLTAPPPTGTAQALAPTGPATVVAAIGTGVPVTVLPADPPSGPAAAQPGGSASPAAPGSGPAAPPATTTKPPVVQPVTLFSDDFESGSASGWSESGGAWSVVSDGGSRVLRQTNPTPGLSRVFNGDTGWADYSLQAQVKPLSFGSPGLAGVTARSGGATTYYRLALTSDGHAVLQTYAGSSSVTTLGSAALSVATGTWYALRIDVSGSTVTGYVNGQRIGSGTGTLAGTGRIGLQTNLATAEFDDVTVIAEG
jgi:hypothetical protein